MPTKPEEFSYIGDGVYVRFEPYGFSLLANDHRFPTDTIFMEPGMLEKLTLVVNQHHGQMVEYVAAQAAAEEPDPDGA